MLERPNYLRESSNVSADPFSEILRFTKAESLVTGSFTAGGAWALRFPRPKQIKFFGVVKGYCWVQLEGQAPVRFETGDVGLLAAPLAYTLSSDPKVRPTDAMTVFSGAHRSTVKLGTGVDFAHVGGHVLLDAVSGKLLADVLPPWIHIRASAPQAQIVQWILAQLVDERAKPRPGAQLASAQLSQLLFIQILRAHLDTSAPKESGWLRAVGDPRIAPSIRAMHDDPGRDWHLDALAKKCAMSRTSFAVHFKSVVGIAPLAYLTRWRMSLAERALSEDDASVAAIARSLGYTSESAFSNAFKRATRQSPRAYRANRRLSPRPAER
jgi:AraC-like DNA-binding protein